MQLENYHARFQACTGLHLSSINDCSSDCNRKDECRRHYFLNVIIYLFYGYAHFDVTLFLIFGLQQKMACY